MPSRTPTRPTVSRRTRRAALKAAWAVLEGAQDDANSDPLVALWREWREAHTALTRLCRRAQRLERALAERVGYPRVLVPMERVDGSPVHAADARDIDRLLGTEPETRASRARLKRELAAARVLWDAEAQACGLTAAVAGEHAAGQRVDAVLRAAAVAPARSLTGVIAKLAIAAEWSEAEPEPDGYPWTFLHSALAALIPLADAA